MGATIALLADQGHNVLLLDMTDGEPTPHGSPAIRARESAAALVALRNGSRQTAGSITRINLGLPNRFVTHSIEARHRVAAVIRAHKASILFVPYFEDAHPDHIAVTRIAEDARFDAKLTRITLPAPPGLYDNAPAAGSTAHTDGSPALDADRFPPLYPRWLFYYYATHLRIVPTPSFIVDVSSTIDRKIASIDAYHSQFAANPKNQAVIPWIRASATYFGSRINTPAGEAFFTREPLGLANLNSVVQ